MTLLEMGLTGAVLVVVIVLVRALILHRLPKGALLLLWWLALARFLLPFSLSSPVSAYTLLNPRADVSSEPFRRFASQQAAENLPPETMPAQTAAETSAQAAPQLPALLLVWGIGSAGCTLFFAVMALRCSRAFRSALPAGQETVKEWLSVHPLRRRVQVRTFERISAPLTYGVFRPVILLPEGFPFQDAALAGYVLTHEWIHIRRMDSLTKYFIIAAVCLHWWNPMVWVLYVLFNRDLELSCDEAVVHRCGISSRADYARALIRMEEQKSGLAPLCSSFNRSAMEERILAIMKMKKVTERAVAASAAAVFAVGVLFATSAQAADPTASTTDNGNEVLSDMYAHPVSVVDWKEERELLESFQKHGISYDNAGKMYYNGERVRWFWDGYEIWEGGTLLGWSMRYEYLDKDGTVDVRTLHARKDNGDGSWDGYGPLLGVAPYSAEEFASRSYEELYGRSTYAVSENTVMTEEPASPGTADITGDTENTGIMEYTEETETAVFSEAGGDVIETVTEERTAVAAGTAGNGAQGGRTFAEIFAAYEAYGIAYEEKDGIRELFYRNEPVAKFIDQKPDGSAFSFEPNSGKVGTLTVRTDYDAAGKLIGLSVD